MLVGIFGDGWKKYKPLQGKSKFNCVFLSLLLSILFPLILLRDLRLLHTPSCNFLRTALPGLGPATNAPRIFASINM
jgi:hypothetical protein